MICPKCGHDLNHQWDAIRGVWMACEHCDFRTKDTYAKRCEDKLRHQKNGVYTNG